MKLWGGRFAKETDTLTDHFNSSISFDMRLYKHDILGSIAHVTMLGKQGIITQTESEQIIKGLNDLLVAIENGEIEFDEKMEDDCLWNFPLSEFSEILENENKVVVVKFADGTYRFCEV